jgi:hypothetical protein
VPCRIDLRGLVHPTDCVLEDIQPHFVRLRFAQFSCISGNSPFSLIWYAQTTNSYRDSCYNSCLAWLEDLSLMSPKAMPTQNALNIVYKLTAGAMTREGHIVHEACHYTVALPSEAVDLGKHIHVSEIRENRASIPASWKVTINGEELRKYGSHIGFT